MARSARAFLLCASLFALLSFTPSVIAGAAPSGAAVPSVGDDRLTKKQWIRGANHICRAADRAVEALPDPSGNLNDVLSAAEFTEIAEFVTSATEIAEDALAELRAMAPPKRDIATVRRILRPLAGSVDAGHAAVAAAEAQDQPTLQTEFERLLDESDRFEAAAKAYGSKCGRSSEGRSS